MSVEVTGLYREIALFADENGPAEIPVREVSRLHYLADRANNARVTRDGRTYHRDTLGAVKRDFENGDLPVLADCSNCHDAPGMQAMGDGKTFCPPCCSAAAGSHYDDRD